METEKLTISLLNLERAMGIEQIQSTKTALPPAFQFNWSQIGVRIPTERNPRVSLTASSLTVDLAKNLGRYFELPFSMRMFTE